MLRKILFVSLCVLPIPSLQAGWKTKSKKSADLTELKMKVETAKLALLEKDPDLQSFFDQAYAFILIPSVKKAATGIGGAFGKGLVFQKGHLVGMAKLRQVSIGLQLGGQSYTEVVFFENAAAYSRFQRGKIELSAQASAVAIKKGASKSGIYHDGLAIFTMTRAGLMYEASIGGQSFKFEPI